MAMRAVRVWVSTRTIMAGTATTRARRRDTRRQSQSNVVRPATSAAKCATCCRRDRPERAAQTATGRALPGEMRSPRTTEPKTSKRKRI